MSAFDPLRTLAAWRRARLGVRGKCITALRKAGEQGRLLTSRCRPAPELAPLARELTWPFVPHVTLADGIEPARAEAALATLADYRAEARIESVHLLQEGPGRVWTPIAEARLGGIAVVGRGGLPLELAVSAHPDPESSAFAAAEWARHDVVELGGPLEGEDVTITGRREGEVVGVARGTLRGGRAHLSELLVAEAVRGQGVGGHLLAAFESWAAERGAARLSVRTRSGSRAEAFYRARGSGTWCEWMARAGTVLGWGNAATMMGPSRHLRSAPPENCAAEGS